jgi:hypothetical protein
MGRTSRASGKAGEQELPLTVTIAKESSRDWKATMMTSGDPSASVPVTAVILDGSNLRLAVYRVGATYEGRVSTDGTFIVGIWRRHGHEMPLVLRRGKNSNSDLRN